MPVRVDLGREVSSADLESAIYDSMQSLKYGGEYFLVDRRDIGGKMVFTAAVQPAWDGLRQVLFPSAGVSSAFKIVSEYEKRKFQISIDPTKRYSEFRIIVGLTDRTIVREYQPPEKERDRWELDGLVDGIVKRVSEL